MTEGKQTLCEFRPTDEHLRILIAIDEGRLTVNNSGRYEIEQEERPDRKSREQLRSRGLIDHFYEQGRGSHWRITAKGKRVLAREMLARREATRAEVDKLMADGMAFGEAWMKVRSRV